MTDEVLTPEELCSYLKIDKGALEKLLEEGDIPARYMGGHWRFSRPAVLHWLGEMSVREAVEYGRQQTIRKQEPSRQPKPVYVPLSTVHTPPGDGPQPPSVRTGISAKHELASRNFSKLSTSQKGDLLADID